VEAGEAPIWPHRRMSDSLCRGRLMMDRHPSASSVPDHVDHAVRSVAQLHSDHRGRATTPQRAVNWITGFMGRPWFLMLLGLGVALWTGANLTASALGLHAVDPPPFPWLEGAISVFSLFVVMLVLVAQKHEDELNAYRDTLTLELAILSEHKVAKVIQLLEELRRDTPQVQDRVDPQAQQMAKPADTGSVLAAVRKSDQS
jgi:uncharacterized membrane protein